MLRQLISITKYIDFIILLTACSKDVATSTCAIDIRHNTIGQTDHYKAYNAWKLGDTRLDWYGHQEGQVSQTIQVPAILTETW